MRSTMRRTRGRLGSALVVSLLALTMLTACGDDESAQDRYCDAGESLRSSIGELTDVDLLAGGTDALDEAIGQVSDDVDELRDAAGDAAEDDVAALDSAVDALRGSLSDLGGELTSENASAVGAAITDVVEAARAVFDTLGDC